MPGPVALISLFVGPPPSSLAISSSSSPSSFLNPFRYRGPVPRDSQHPFPREQLLHYVPADYQFGISPFS